jgi:hypothetical protein
VVSVLVEPRMSVGIEGKYLKLGKRKADAVAVDEAGNEELLTRTLLNGCSDIPCQRCSY